MANEELIYRITRAVYDRSARPRTRQTVEQLVTDIYREVEPQSRNGSAPRRHSLRACGVGAASRQEGSSDRLIISVFGVDHPGIVAGVSQILAEAVAASSTSIRRWCRASLRWSSSPNTSRAQ